MPFAKEGFSLNNADDLLEKIRKTREELARLIQEKGSIDHPALLEKSRQLDELINEYHKKRPPAE